MDWGTVLSISISSRNLSVLAQTIPHFANNVGQQFETVLQQ